MKKGINLFPTWLRVSRNRRNELIQVAPCDPKSPVELEAVSSVPTASIRVIRGQYTWSIPVRMFCAVERAGR